MGRRGWKIRRQIACILLIALAGLNGCRDDMEIKVTTGLNVGELFRVENEPCTLSEARLFLMNQKNRYEAAYGQNIWAVPVGEESFADYMKAELQDFLVRLKTMVRMADKEGIVLSEDEEGRVAAAAEEYMKGLGEEAVAYTDITPEQVEKLYRQYRLAELLVRQLTADINEEISDDAARVIEVQQVALYKERPQEGGTDGSIDEPDEAALRERAQEVARLAAQGEVFVNLQEIYSDEEGGNLRVSRYDVEPEWEEAVFRLGSGEVSGVIETEDGFYVVRCVSNMLAAETQANKEVIRERQRAEVFYSEYAAFAEGLTTLWDEEGWKKFDFTEEEIPKCQVDFYAVYETYFGRSAAGS